MSHVGRSIYQTPDVIDEPLYVITAISNPIRFKTRWKHYQRFAAHVKDSGGILYTVEAAFGERRSALIDRAPEDADSTWKTASATQEPHKYLQVRMDSELWVKENLMNLGVQALPDSWKYVAFIDADIQFARPNWVGETIHQLQHYSVVQMFSEAQDVGPHYVTVHAHKSFMWCWMAGLKKPKWRKPGQYDGPPGKGPNLWHPGFAWAYTREAINGLGSHISAGSLIDFAILGAADNHMAHALIGLADDSLHPQMGQTYRDLLHEWQWQAHRHVRQNVGVMSGTIIHYWHGRKVDRKYWDRWRILVENQYNPITDIKYDWRGVLSLQDRGTPRSIKLRDDIMRYFRSRQEDSIDLSGIGDVS